MERKATEYQNDAANAHNEAVKCFRLGMYEAASYWQGRARHFADMARFFMGMR